MTFLSYVIPSTSPYQPACHSSECIDVAGGMVSYNPNKPSMHLLDTLVARDCCVFLTTRNNGLGDVLEVRQTVLSYLVKDRD